MFAFGVLCVERAKTDADESRRKSTEDVAKSIEDRRKIHLNRPNITDKAILSTFGVHLGTLWNHFFNTIFDIIFRPPFEPKNKPVLAMEREARRKLKLCFINVLELANTHQQRYSRTAEIASTP